MESQEESFSQVTYIKLPPRKRIGITALREAHFDPAEVKDIGHLPQRTHKLLLLKKAVSVTLFYDY